MFQAIIFTMATSPKDLQKNTFALTSKSSWALQCHGSSALVMHLGLTNFTLGRNNTSDLSRVTFSDFDRQLGNFDSFNSLRHDAASQGAGDGVVTQRKTLKADW